MKSMYESIQESEFINYRKFTSFTQRLSFRRAAKNAGEDYIPVVLDSVDTLLSMHLAEPDQDPTLYRQAKYGKECVIFRYMTIDEFKKNIVKNYGNLQMYLQSGELVTDFSTINDVYKLHSSSDGILYIMLTREQTFYAYIKSIMAYLYDAVKSRIGYS